ncbi:MAG: glutamyl-tRNA(Gln) amidotransferase, subunit D [Candidatus Parvarchaeum acidophilus ARMAN-5]|jgi:glutamyl-tRNA(Gln) amidotransferase subunit D|uniref:Glutamyl-tRNA(Gln) amidotransferase subunit D n=1 Tax=Candidatus Parvarchaeum acidophilus ARMAN-5 TaxID=662762 RepID=D6GVI8_PARA5|nr:MAG: glutamyl-tRNA(Gln) amidotransferase, subunit D [Candidatus Parvarchaeum acidophilus ARMAN-5]
MDKRKITPENLTFGDFISIDISGQEFHGEFIKSDNGLIVVKLKSGYDIALPYKEINSISIIEKNEIKDETKKEEKIKTVEKADITIITTGGTISSKIDYKTGGVSPSVESDYYFKISPDLNKQGKIEIFNLMSKLSENMLPSDWLEIAKAAYSSINKGSRGIVVTSGTDTMHFAASAISFLLNPLSIPVVFTGSQRSTDRGSTDASTNLLLSAITARDFDAGESVICMHANLNDKYNNILRGNKARKMHTERRDAFRPINIAPLAKVYSNGKFSDILSERIKRAEETKLTDKIDQKVKLIYGYPSMGGDIIEYYTEKNIHGLVISGTGFGNLPLDDKTVVSALKKAENNGIPITITSQAIYGATNKFVYSTLREISKFENIIYVGDMTTETAFVKMMFALGKSKKIEEIKNIMTSNLAGEIKNRSKVEEFLL